MIEIIEGNLFDTDAKFICHQVNCMGEMGSGVALQMKQRFPHVYEEYKKVASSDMLGKVQIVPVKPKYIGYDCGSIAIPSNEQWICNFFAQDNYGYDGKQYTSLEALEKCFRTMCWKAHERNNNFSATIAMPYKIGCDRGGADWDEVYSMMQKIFNELDTHVELWKLNQ